MVTHVLTIQYPQPHDKPVFLLNKSLKTLEYLLNLLYKYDFYKKTILNSIYKYIVTTIYTRKFPVFAVIFMEK